MIKDPIADMINRIKIASTNGFSSVDIPFSKFKFSIARTLASNGFVGKVILIGEGMEKKISINIIPKKIKGATMISKPGCKVYVGADRIKPIKNGQGISIISTSSGVMAGHRAYSQNIGGEFLFFVY